MDLEYFERPSPGPMAAPLGTTHGTMPCPKGCGRTVPYRPGTYGHVIAECPVCLNTLVATNTVVAGDVPR
jgi:hypothetical protein